MKKLTTTIGDEPINEDEARMLLLLMSKVNDCFTAFILDLEVTIPDCVLGKVAAGSRKQFAARVSECNRVTAYLTIPNMGPVAEISFSNGKTLVYKFGLGLNRHTGEFFVCWK